MKSVEIIGYKRANLGKADAKALRLESLVPCVLYGTGEQIHFSVPMILFRELAYSPVAYLADLNIEGKKYRAILQDVQFHAVNDMLMHADFLALQDDKPVRTEIPVKLEGTAVGVTKGGKLTPKLRKLKIEALPANLPDFISVDITDLDLGKTIKVSAVKPENYKILNVGAVPLVSIEIPRALKTAQKEGK
ncbi:MAG: 50S ribosomal protein L25/general stress protein Ctc [Bacteroidota bacterium]